MYLCVSIRKIVFVGIVVYRRISHILTHKGYRSSKTNSILKQNFIYSIYKKGKIREERYGRVFESKIENTFCYVL